MIAVVVLQKVIMLFCVTGVVRWTTPFLLTMKAVEFCRFDWSKPICESDFHSPALESILTLTSLGSPPGRVTVRLLNKVGFLKSPGTREGGDRVPVRG